MAVATTPFYSVERRDRSMLQIEASQQSITSFLNKMMSCVLANKARQCSFAGCNCVS